MTNFIPGARVVFKAPYDIFPCNLIISAGETGTVREIANGLAYVTLDEKYSALSDWNNAVEFSEDQATDNGETLHQWLARFLVALPERGMLAEFPRFASSDMPDMPAGFVDQSWHNDALPHWENADARLMLWIDHSNAEERDHGRGVRFALYAMDDSGAMVEPVLLESEAWSAMSNYIDALVSCANNETGAKHRATLQTNEAWKKLVGAGFSIWNSGGGIYLWAKEFPVPHQADKFVMVTMAQDAEDLGEDGAQDGWNVEVSGVEGDYVPAYDFRTQTLDACLAYVARYVPVFANADEIADNAINTIALNVQDAIGQTDGGCAGDFFSDHKFREAIAEIVREYIGVEMLYADGKE